jgi:hypothetical protein
VSHQITRRISGFVSAYQERVLDGDEKRQFDVMNRLYTEDNKPHHEHRNQIPDQNWAIPNQTWLD